MKRVFTLVALAVMAMGCASKSEVDQLKVEVESLKQKLEELGGGATGARAAAAREAPSAAGGANAEAEASARALYQEAQQLARGGDNAGARAKVVQLQAQFGGTRTASRADRFLRELEVVGKDTTALVTTDWFVGDSAGFDVSSDAALIVFFETWCPHCRREMPELQETFERYQGRMSVLGLTKVTRSSTDDKVREFVAEHELSYPVAKEDGSMSEYYAVSGIPAAVIIKDGKVLWRGHPGQLDDDAIEGYLSN